MYAPPKYERARVLLSQASAIFPGLQCDDYSEWMGARPSTPDSVPVIGRSRRHAAVFYAFGHGHTGMAGAPMTGKLISELVVGRNPSIDVAPYSPYRF